MHPGNPDLVQFIRDLIRRDGPVTFAWFMEQALYHPELGYYSSGRCEIGRRGDYFTSVSVGPLFGRMIAAQFVEMWKIMGQPADFTIVEQGAHHGELANDVLTELGELARQLRYWIIEPSPILRRRQEETLAKFCDNVTWRGSLAELESFSGVHFSNELLDSMPVRLIASEAGDEWQEKFVADSGDTFVFVTKPIVDEELLARLEKIPKIGNAPYETEVNLAASDWIEGVAGKLRRGFILAVDYGFPRAQFYASQRSTGTLQAFARHRPVSSPLEAAGHVDITAHVDWTSIAESAEQSGLNPIGFTDQHHFLTGLLGLRPPDESERRALQTLMHPEFLGTRYQCLALGKDAPAFGLSGFRFARDPRQALELR